MNAADDIFSLAADFIARVTAYLFGLQSRYAPKIISSPNGPAIYDNRLVRAVAWDGGVKGAQPIYTTPNNAPHLRMGGIPAVRLSGARRCPARCRAQRWRVIFCAYLTYTLTLRGDIVLPSACITDARRVGHDPPLLTPAPFLKRPPPKLDLGG